MGRYRKLLENSSDINKWVVAIAFFLLFFVCAAPSGYDAGMPSLTIKTGGFLKFGTTQWDDGSDKIDGEQIADNTIDADSLDVLYAAGQTEAGAATSGDSATSFFSGGILEVGIGGTGADKLTAGGVLLGSGTSAVTPMAVLADSEFIVGDGTTGPVAESGATARTSLGLGVGDSVEFGNVLTTGTLGAGQATITKMNLGGGLTAFVLNGVSLDAIVGATSQIATELQYVALQHSNVALAGSRFMLSRSRGTLASPLIVADNDSLAAFDAAAYDGTDYVLAGEIDFEVDGTPGGNDMPGRIVFKTTADGGILPAAKWTVKSTGHLLSGTDGTGSYNINTAGILTAGGLTLGANENITLGAQTLDHDGTDFVFNDSIKATAGVFTGNIAATTAAGSTDNYLSLIGADDKDAYIILRSDRSDDNGDDWKINVPGAGAQVQELQFMTDVGGSLSTQIRFQTDGDIYTSGDIHATIFTDATFSVTGGTMSGIVDLGQVDTADIDAGTVDGASIGQTTPGLIRGTKIEVDNNTTYIDKDGSNNMTFTDAVTGTLTLAEMSCPPLVNVTDSTVAEGYNDITSFENKVLVKWIEIETTSVNWTITVYDDDDAPGANPRELLSNQNGNENIYWDYPYEDADASSEFHYNFTDNAGSATHDIIVSGTKLR